MPSLELDLKTEIGSLVGLDPQDQLIGARNSAAGGIKQVHRSFFEGEHHLTHALGHALAGTHIEGHPCQRQLSMNSFIAT